jgi:hypothetical protein
LQGIQQQLRRRCSQSAAHSSPFAAANASSLSSGRQQQQHVQHNQQKQRIFTKQCATDAAAVDWMALLMNDTPANADATANSTAAVRTASSSNKQLSDTAAAEVTVALRELEQQLADLEQTWQAVLPGMQLSH